MSEEYLAAVTAYIQKDPFAKHLGATIEEIRTGYGRVSLTITADMLNFHGITHGGLIFTLGDIAFAAASNSHGQTAVALNVDIGFMRATRIGDQLIAEAQERDINGPIGLYDITITNTNSNELIAQSQATVYRKRETFINTTT
ncbi:MAG: hotdog fold thioesterase [Anaerolineales bacterium]|nr:hotdog fold thioesterase [Anaerolineales bacterium]